MQQAKAKYNQVSAASPWSCWAVWRTTSALLRRAQLRRRISPLLPVNTSIWLIFTMDLANWSKKAAWLREKRVAMRLVAGWLMSPWSDLNRPCFAIRSK